MATVVLIYSTQGTYNWTCPIDVWDLVPADDNNFFECYGGGGAGGGKSLNGGGGGGSGGCYSKLIGSEHFYGNRIYTIVVGAAVLGVLGSTGNNGNQSKISTVASGDICLTKGGLGGTTTAGASAPTLTGNIGDTKRVGGAGESPFTGISGSGGGGAGTSSDGEAGGTDLGGVGGVGGEVLPEQGEMVSLQMEQ